MSECVVRMEMPEKCFSCDLRYECNAFYAPGKPKPFMKGCRIICALPESHGRLVDKEEMLKKIENYHRYMTVGRESDPRCIIEDSPTIVPAEAERSKI